MAFSESQPTVTMIAATTFSDSDLHKFLMISTDTAEVAIVESTAPDNVIGTLLSQTYSTSPSDAESVTVGLLQGIGKVYMLSSTENVGSPIGCSTNGFGVIASATTDTLQLGYIVEGSSGGTGRIVSVLFQLPTTPTSTSAGF